MAFAGLFFAFAFFSSDLRIRYISPIIPPLVILSVFGVKNIVEIIQKCHSRKIGQRVLAAVFFLVLVFSMALNAHYLIMQFRHVDPFDYIDGTLNRDQYIEKFILEYPVIRYINEDLPAKAKLLFIFLGKRGYYCDRNYQLDNGLFYRITKMSNSPEQVLSELKNQGITHLLIRYDIFDKWKKVIFNEKEINLLNEFMRKYMNLKFFKWGYGVSRLDSHGL